MKNPSYLALITDAYSKKIFGYNVSQSLAVDGSVIALEMGLRSRMYKKNRYWFRALSEGFIMLK